MRGGRVCLSGGTGGVFGEGRMCLSEERKGVLE